MKSVGNKTWAADEPIDTPFRKARQEWDKRMGSAVVQARAWKRVAFGCLGMVFVSLLGIIYLGAQPKAVPHIVEIDKLGSPRYAGRAGDSASALAPSAASVRHHLARFITDIRSLSSDPAVVKANWLSAYSLATEKGANQLNALAKQSEPFARLLSLRVGVEILTLVPLSKDTWQGDWRETLWDKHGNQTGIEIWRGSFRVALRVPDSEEALTRNPIGLFIDEFHLARVAN